MRIQAALWTPMSHALSTPWPSIYRGRFWTAGELKCASCPFMMHTGRLRCLRCLRWGVTIREDQLDRRKSQRLASLAQSLEAGLRAKAPLDRWQNVQSHAHSGSLPKVYAIIESPCGQLRTSMVSCWIMWVGISRSRLLPWLVVAGGPANQADESPVMEPTIWKLICNPVLRTSYE